VAVLSNGPPAEGAVAVKVRVPDFPIGMVVYVALTLVVDVVK
jgi:hypothetical protein